MRCLRRIVFVAVFSCLALALAHTASASETFLATDGVRLRTDPTTDSAIVRVVNQGSSVDVLEHDPAGWSMVKVNGSTGYIKSEYLKFPLGGAPAIFRTTDDVRLREGPSTDAGIISVIVHGTGVSVLVHDPAGWSKVTVGGSTGYIRSDFLTRDIAIPAQPVPAASQAPTTLWTSDAVRLRSGPSTDSAIIRTLNAGTSVSVQEQGSNGWSKVSQNGTVGYIRSDLLSANPSGGSVEYLDWSNAKNLVQTGVAIRVLDVRTGLSYTIRCFSKGGHADVEPLTAADTDTILKTRGGVWAWDPRPVWVTISGRTVAASINGMPHAGSTISGNNMNGHLCLHFGGTVTNNKSYQNDLRNAVQEAYNAAR